MCRKCLEVIFSRNNEENEKELLEEYGIYGETSVEEIACNVAQKSKYEIKKEGIKITGECETGISLKDDLPVFYINMWIGKETTINDMAGIYRNINFCPYCGEKLGGIKK